MVFGITLKVDSLSEVPSRRGGPAEKISRLRNWLHVTLPWIKGKRSEIGYQTATRKAKLTSDRKQKGPAFLQALVLLGAPGRIRTHDPLVRSRAGGDFLDYHLP